MTAEGAAFGTGAGETYDEARAVSLYCDRMGEFHKRRGHTYLCTIVPFSKVAPLGGNALSLLYGVVPEPDESTRVTYLKVAPPKSRKRVRDVPFLAPGVVGEGNRCAEAGYRRGHKYAEVSARVHPGAERHRDGERYTLQAGDNQLGLLDGGLQGVGGLAWFEIGLDLARFNATTLSEGMVSTAFEPIDWRLRLYCPCGKRYQMTREQALAAYRNALDNGIHGVPVRLCATSF